MTLVFPYLQSFQGSFGKGLILKFPVEPQSGLHTLDSIQAALNFKNITGILPLAEAVTFGYSSGALATELASELHAHQALKPQERRCGIGWSSAEYCDHIYSCQRHPASAQCLGHSGRDERLPQYRRVFAQGNLT